MQVAIGTDYNKRSLIRENNYSEGPVTVQTDRILSADEFRGFWIKSSGGVTEAGRENEVKHYCVVHNFKGALHSTNAFNFENVKIFSIYLKRFGQIRK